MALLSLLASAATGLAQDNPKPVLPLQVKGVVQEADSGLPVVNARVSFVEGSTSTAVAHRESNLVTQSGPDGKFQMTLDKAGAYVVSVEAPGYIVGPGVPYYFNIGGRLPSLRTVTLRMRKPASISGRLVDDETGKPLRGFHVVGWTVGYRLGQRKLWSDSPVPESMTDEAGRFRLEGLAPGWRLFHFIAPDARKPIEIDPAAKSHKAAEQQSGYGQLWFPGGDKAQLESAMLLSPGQSVDLGDIKVARRPLHSITGFLPAHDCDSARRYKLAIDQGTEGTYNADAELACDSRFRLAGLVPGDYFLALDSVNGASESHFRKWISLTDRDETVELQPMSPLILHGKLVAPDSFPANSRIRVSLVTVPDERSVARPVTVAKDQPFEMTDGVPGPVLLRVDAAPKAPYYISRILYNGSNAPDGAFEPNFASMGQSLEITVADDGAALSGDISEKGTVVAGATAVMVPWPVRMKNGFPVFRTALADQNGKFTLAANPPGTYRVLAIREWTAGLDKPGVLGSYMENAPTVELGPSASQHVSLELTWTP